MTDMHDRAPAYVLDALDDLERRAFERHLDSCEDCVREVAELTGGVERLFDEVAEAAPPRLRSRVLEETGLTDPSPPVSVPLPPAPSDARPWMMAAVAAAVVAVVAGMAAVLLQARVSQTERVTEILASPDATIVDVDGLDARVVAVDGAAVFITDDLPEPEADRAYQLWVIDDAGPVSAGVFTPDRSGESVVVLEGDVPAGTVIGLTEEPEGGSPAPTGDILATAEV